MGKNDRGDSLGLLDVWRCIDVVEHPVDLVESHDSFAATELVHFDDLRLCDPGMAGKFIDEGGPPPAPTRSRSTSPAVWSQRVKRSVAPVPPTSSRSPCTSEARPAIDKSPTPRSMTHVIGLGSTCAVHILGEVEVDEGFGRRDVVRSQGERMRLELTPDELLSAEITPNPQAVHV